MYTFEKTEKYQDTVKKKADGKTGKRDADRKTGGKKTPVNIEECIPNLSLRDRDVFFNNNKNIFSLNTCLFQFSFSKAQQNSSGDLNMI